MRYPMNEQAVRDGIERTAWLEDTGLAPEDLKKACLEMEAAGKDRPLAIRKADLMALILDRAQIAVSPEDVFADRIRHANILTNIEYGWRNASVTGELKAVTEETQDGILVHAWDGYSDFSHSCPDYPRLFAIGLPGVEAELVKYSEREGLTGEQKTFYTASLTAVRALRRLATRLAEAADRYPDAPCARLASKLLRAVRDRAPRSVDEALQLVQLIYIPQTEIENTLVRSLGRMDRDLYELYKSDLANGVSQGHIEDMFRYFFMRFTAMNHPNNVPLCLGGRGSFGPGGINELTETMFSVYASMNIYCPKIQIRVTPETPDDFLRRVLDQIRLGNSSYVFMSDGATVEGLMRLGLTQTDAENYIPVGCYEPGSMGKELSCTTAGTVSLAQAVQLALFNGKEPLSGKQIGPETGLAWDTEEDFLRAVETQIRFCSDAVLRRVRACEARFGDQHPAPLFSAWTESCVERGVDAYRGGMIYNNSSVNFIGIATAVDSVLAILTTVLREHRFTWDSLRETLLSDWEGHEQDRMYALRRCPKYGSGSAEAEQMTSHIAEFSAGCVNCEPNARGGVFRAGFFSIDWIYAWGQSTAATADGRRKGEPLSKNLSAVIGMDMQGPTSLARCAACAAGRIGVNGSILDCVLHTSACRGETGMEAMLSLVKTYFREGGQGIQMNVMNAEMLRAAQEFPDQYRSLQVRVCGWNAYFVNLSLVEQNDFIRSAEAAAV